MTLHWGLSQHLLLPNVWCSYKELTQTTNFTTQNICIALRLLLLATTGYYHYFYHYQRTTTTIIRTQISWIYLATSASTFRRFSTTFCLMFGDFLLTVRLLFAYFLLTFATFRLFTGGYFQWGPLEYLAISAFVNLRSTFLLTCVTKGVIERSPLFRNPSNWEHFVIVAAIGMP
jgi:hypothetical protein